MAELVDLIASSHGRWMAPVVEAVCGTSEPGQVAEALTAAVTNALGSSVARARFYEPGVGIVAGLELSDGRSVVAKVHRASYLPREHLEAIVELQAHLAAAGLPAPAPLSPLLSFGRGWLTIEALRAGESANGLDPAVRAAMAGTLHAFVQATRAHARSRSLASWPGEAVIDGLWPEPHDLRFDFPGTAKGAEWIDDCARAARQRLAATTIPDVVGHLDWRVQNLAFAGRDVCAIYDWDSLRLASEPAVVGSASVVHPIDWRLDLADPLPRLDQVDGFVADYEAARGSQFDAAERVVLAAAQTWTVSYGARSQHSDDVTGFSPDVDHTKGWPRLLRDLVARTRESP